MHSTLSLLTCSSESEEDDEETFADLQTEDDNHMHQISLDEDQGTTIMLFMDTEYIKL